MHTEHNLDQTETRTVNRRRFLQTAGVTTVLTLAGGAQAWLGSASAASGGDGQAKTTPTNATFTLPPLPYDYNALEPHIDTLTMQIHHTRHHAAYVTNLNTALKDYPDLQKRDATDLISNLDRLPEAIRTTVRNNGGGHVNHAIFWAIMAPKAGGEPQGQLRKAIGDTFGDFANFKAQINDAGARRFGSGWSWLVMDVAGKLQITSTANQDNPYMFGQTPLLGVDVWEHAYYLKYQNRRADYLNAFWNVVNWHAVGQRFEKARG